MQVSLDNASGTIALYVDGALVETATGNKAPLDAPERIVVGRLQPGGHGFRGDIDELCFFDRALAAAAEDAARALRAAAAAAIAQPTPTSP